MEGGGKSRRKAAAWCGNWGVKHDTNEMALLAYVTYSDSRHGAESENTANQTQWTLINRWVETVTQIEQQPTANGDKGAITERNNGLVARWLGLRRSTRSFNWDGNRICDAAVTDQEETSSPNMQAAGDTVTARVCSRSEAVSVYMLRSSMVEVVEVR